MTCLLGLTACSDVDPEAAESSPPDNVLTVTGTDPLSWSPPVATVAPGEVELIVECGLSVAHEFAIEGVQDGETLVSCDAASVGTGSVELEEGVYNYVCNVPGHREEGMVGELTVEG
jgi:plastocyanin